MLDVNDYIQLETILKDFISKKQKFTAYDVTKTYRNNLIPHGMHKRILHSDVKEFVINYMNKIKNYSSQIFTSDDKKWTADVYFSNNEIEIETETTKRDFNNCDEKNSSCAQEDCKTCDEDSEDYDWDEDESDEDEDELDEDEDEDELDEDEDKDELDEDDRGFDDDEATCETCIKKIVSGEIRIKFETNMDNIQEVLFLAEDMSLDLKEITNIDIKGVTLKTKL